jgi:hypothetical protein
MLCSKFLNTEAIGMQTHFFYPLLGKGRRKVRFRIPPLGASLTTERAFFVNFPYPTRDSENKS